MPSPRPDIHPKFAHRLASLWDCAPGKAARILADHNAKLRKIPLKEAS